MPIIHTTNDIKSDENAQVQMSAETYRFVMSWDNYPEPATGERQVKLGVYARIPNFSVLNFKDGIRCFPAYGPTVFEQREPRPGAGFCEGNHYGERAKPKTGRILSKERWQTQTSKAAWRRHTNRMRQKERASIRLLVFPRVPKVCVMCRDLNPSKSICKLPEQSMGSLCSTFEKKHKTIITPENKEHGSYMGSLRQKLDKFEKRNRPPKIWSISTLPTFNRNDGKLLRYYTNEAGEPIRVYQDSNPRMVPEIAFSHDRTEDRSGYDECAFPDDWRMDLAESGGNDDTVFMDINDNREIKRQCFEIPKPNWVTVTRTRRIFTGEFRTYYTQDKFTELHKVWHWDPVKKFIFTIEERTVVVPVRHDLAVMRTEEYPTLINVQTEKWFEKDIKREAKVTGRSEDELRAENTSLVQSSTVITKKERGYYYARREVEMQKLRLTGYLIARDAGEGKSIAPKHNWPIRSKKTVAPTVQVPLPAGR